MDTKLTLSLNQVVIEAAKAYAKEKNISLSKLIENYLDSLTKSDARMSTTPLVESLAASVSIREDFDLKEAYHSHLREKYAD